MSIRHWLAVATFGLAVAGAATPSQGLPPPTCGTQGFMVFFGPNTAALTNTAITTNGHVLTAWRADGGPILLEGHADGAEAATGRGSLGELRAKAIRDWLVANGVESDAIWVRGWSDTRLMVSTAKGPEAQNRRVEIKVTLASRKCELAADRARSEWIVENCFNSLTWQYSRERCKSILKEIGRREPYRQP